MASKIKSEDMAVAVPQMLKKIDELNNMVMDKVNKTQELCLLVAFDQESSEYRIKKSIEERISSIAAWHWVLKDLSKRLNEAVDTIQHEKDAVMVVIERLKDEINHRVEKASRPGILAPRCDAVEEAIFKEYRYLRKQNVLFTKEALNLDDVLRIINETKGKIDKDLRGKEMAIAVEEASMNHSQDTTEYNQKQVPPKIKKKSHAALSSRNCTPEACKKITSWQKRCNSLKADGLYALRTVMEERARIRAMRFQLSCGAWERATRVDAALRRRLHTNMVILEELEWQTKEALSDLEKLNLDRETTENTILELFDKARATEVRLAERACRPPAELMDEDDVDKLLRGERAQLKRNIKKFQENLNNIISLQNKLTKAVTEIENRVADVKQVLSIDEARIHDRQSDGRQDEESMNDDTGGGSCFSCETHTRNTTCSLTVNRSSHLDQIPEEDEDNYPFNF